MSERDLSLHGETFIVRPAMPNPARHLPDQPLRVEAVPSHHNPGDPAHPGSPPQYRSNVLVASCLTIVGPISLSSNRASCVRRSPRRDSRIARISFDPPWSG